MSREAEPEKSETESQDRVIHEVDGIEEYDNKLPNWWLYTLYGAIVFAVLYWFHYQVAGFGDSPRAEYQAQVDKAAADEAARIKTRGVVTADTLAALARDKQTVLQGREVFAQTCAVCHRQDGGGNVGPNLTDDFWLHGASPDKIYKTITEGVASKGMPSWGSQLGADRVQAVTAYVLTLRGTNVAGGKAPQGERETLSER
jgi:cytochrome c oxidase cbb3-type subunit 3